MSDEKTLTMDEFKAQLSDMFDSKIREMGLDKVDRKHGIFPSKDDPNGDDLKDLSKDEKIAKFLRAVVIGDAKVAKQLAEGTGADGGYLVPVEFRASVLEKLVKEAVIRPRATVIPMGRDKMEVPAEAGGVTAYWVAENTDLTPSEPDFDQIVLNTNKLTGLSKMSRELFADSAVNVSDYITRMFAKKFAAEEDLKFMTGAGTTEPTGLRTYTVTDTPQAAASLVGDDLIALFYSLPVQYRRNAVWLMHNSIIKLVRQLKSVIDGRYIWTDGLADAPATILGRPVLEQNDIPIDLGTGTDESEIWFGDLSYYLLGDRQTMEVETTTQGAGTFEKHQVAIKLIERIDGQLGLTDAFAKLSAVK
jgi:HK97 family phage major capsid protein